MENRKDFSPKLCDNQPRLCAMYPRKQDLIDWMRRSSRKIKSHRGVSRALAHPTTTIKYNVHDDCDPHCSAMRVILLLSLTLVAAIPIPERRWTSVSDHWQINLSDDL